LAASGARSFRLKAWAELFFITVAAALAASAFFLARERGTELAAAAMRGGAVSTPILSVSAQPVCLVWTSAQPTGEIGAGPFVYLGQSASTAFLFNFKSQPKGALRVPLGDVIITAAIGEGRSARCP